MKKARSSHSCTKLSHGAIIRTGITCKSIEFGMALKQSATRYKQKNVSLPDHHLTENLILIFGV